MLRTRDELLGIKRFELTTKDVDQKSLQVTRSFRKTDDISFVLSELSLNIEKLATQLEEKNLVTNKVSAWIKEVTAGEEIYRSEDVELAYYSNKGSDLLKALYPFFEKRRSSTKALCKGSGIYAHSLRRRETVPQTLFDVGSLDEEKDILSTLSISGKVSAAGIVRGSSLAAFNKRKDTKKEEDKQSSYLASLPYPYLGMAS